MMIIRAKLIDFLQNLWKDEDALIVTANILDDEVRYALISVFKDKCYTALFKNKR